jgi:hypothetical protein
MHTPLPVSLDVRPSSVTLVERKSNLDKRVWMQLVGDSAMILGH